MKKVVKLVTVNLGKKNLRTWNCYCKFINDSRMCLSKKLKILKLINVSRIRGLWKAPKLHDSIQ